MRFDQKILEDSTRQQSLSLCFTVNILRFWPCAIRICHGRAESARTWAPVDLQGPELRECRQSLTESRSVRDTCTCLIMFVLCIQEAELARERDTCQRAKKKVRTPNSQIWLRCEWRDPPFSNPSQNCISRLHYVHPYSVCFKDFLLELMCLIFLLDPLGTSSAAWYELGTARNHFLLHPSYKPKWVYRRAGYPGGWKNHGIPSLF